MGRRLPALRTIVLIILFACCWTAEGNYGFAEIIEPDDEEKLAEAKSYYDPPVEGSEDAEETNESSAGKQADQIKPRKQITINLNRDNIKIDPDPYGILGKPFYIYFLAETMAYLIHPQKTWGDSESPALGTHLGFDYQPFPYMGIGMEAGYYFSNVGKASNSTAFAGSLYIAARYPNRKSWYPSIDMGIGIAPFAKFFYLDDDQPSLTYYYFRLELLRFRAKTFMISSMGFSFGWRMKTPDAIAVITTDGAYLKKAIYGFQLISVGIPFGF